MFETLIFFLLVTILIVLIIFKNATARAIAVLQAEIMDLRQQAARQTQKPLAAEQPPVDPLPPLPLQPPPYNQKDVIPPVREEEVVPEEPGAAPIPEPEIIMPPVAAITEVPEVALPVAEKVRTPETYKPAAPTFWEKNPDIEKFIGENLFNKIGIAVLVLGIGFFLKYAIDKDWINEIGRTFIGILCGGLLIGLAHRMRKTFAPFSSVLIGGGVSVLYFTITIAFHQYHLIGQALAFILTILITAFTVLLALSYNRKELAIIAILGGFSAPFMVSTGEGNVVVLFTYMLILNIGMLVLAYYKKWNIVNVICYAATVILYGGWLTYKINNEAPLKPVPYGIALLYGTLFYIVFFLMNVINNVRNEKKFSFLDISILLTNTFFYYAAGMVILQHISGGAYQGLFTALIAVFNCIFAYSLYRNNRADRTLIYLLIGLVLTFVSLAAPVQLHGNYITLFWAAETVLLLWLWQKSGIVLMKYVSLIVLGLMSFSLLMDWDQLYFEQEAHFLPFINKAFITGAVAVAALFFLRRLSKKERTDESFVLDIPVKIYTGFLTLGAILLIYIVLILECWYQSEYYFPLLTPVITGAYNYLFIAVVLYISRNNAAWARLLTLALALIAAFVFPVYYNTAIIHIRSAVLAGKAPAGYFYVHYLLMIFWAGMIYQAYKTVLSLNREDYLLMFQWFTSAMVLYVISASLDHLVVFIASNATLSLNQLLHNSHRVGFAILWGAFAFILIYLGLRWKSKTVRIISISVFGLTLLKLFLFDFSGLGEGGKIAAFISLGIILLVISFMYQRLKKIIFKDDQQQAVPESNE